MLLTTVVHPCPLTVVLTTVVHPCPLTVLLTTVVHPCPLTVVLTTVVHPCPLTVVLTRAVDDVLLTEGDQFASGEGVETLQSTRGSKRITASAPALCGGREGGKER